MLRDLDETCDVVGCTDPAVDTYMNGYSHPGYRFFVCADHRDRLVAGVQPVIVAERFDLAQMYAPPALLME